MNMKSEMEKRLSSEKTFDKLEQALDYAILLQRTSDEDVMIFKNPLGKFCAVHIINSEIAIQLGYTLVYGFDEIVYAANSDKIAMEAIREFHNLVK